MLEPLIAEGPPVPAAVKAFFRAHPRPAIAFSGGTDSAYLLYCACRCCADVTAYFVRTPFQTRAELERAIEVALDLKANLCLLNLDILNVPEVAANGPDRCYRCKTALLNWMLTAAGEDGRSALADGTNASDDPAERPGMRALEELGIASPLRDAGLTKEMVRERSKAAGLPTWDLPSDSCLATRIPAGTAITAEDLRRTERAETALRALGLTDLRVRQRGRTARVEVPAALLPQAERLLPQIRTALAGEYGAVTLASRRAAGTAL